MEIYSNAIEYVVVLSTSIIAKLALASIAIALSTNNEQRYYYDILIELS